MAIRVEIQTKSLPLLVVSTQDSLNPVADLEEVGALVGAERTIGYWGC
jgi:hypothetical protein